LKNIDVIVVSYNSAGFLPRLADSLKRTNRLLSVTIVDNNSSDDSVELARALDWGAPSHVMPLRENVGFGTAMNRGAFALERSGSRILIVNPDVSISPETLEALDLDLDASENVAVVGAVLRTASGAPVSSARDFPSPSTIARRTVHEVEHGGLLVEVDWVCGALMLWSRQAFTAVRGFSEEYFLYYEDVDVCRKVRAAGWSVMLDGRYGAVHDQGHGQPTSQRLRKASRASRRIYARKWYGAHGVIASAVADSVDVAARLYHRLRGH
jgi:N-acetylglucosaminyl-diphospho-decaprenol L-rhamnosyltransferase